MSALLLPEATPHDLARIAAFIEACCASLPMTPRALYQLKLAVDEACTNVLEHAYAGTGRLEIHCEVGSEHVCVRVRDWGVPFDPTTAPPLDGSLSLEARRAGGMGIHLIRQCVEQIQHTAEVDGNTLTLVKYLSA